MLNQQNNQPQADINTTTSTPNEVDYLSAQIAEEEIRLSAGVNWFYWIAALSVINTAIILAGSDRAFGLGLGITLIFDSFAHELEGALKAIPLIMSFTITAAFAAFGYMGNKKHTWAIVTGMILYLLDGGLLLLIAVLGWGLPIIGLLIHAYALYCLFTGFQACQRIKELEPQGMLTSHPPMPPKNF